MGNRSNINLVGNTTQGQNLGAGDACVFKEKYAGNTLRFRSIVGSGDTTVTETDEQIIIWSSGGTGGSGTGLTTAMNGLTDDGTNVCLGGALTENDVDIFLNDMHFAVCDNNVKFDVSGYYNCIGLCAATDTENPMSRILVGTDAAGMYTWNSTVSQAEVFTNQNGLVILCSGSGSTNTHLEMKPSCVCVYSDSPSFKGIQYAADYSANYTDRSLIDKGYFAAHSGGSGGGITWNGSTANAVGTYGSSSTIDAEANLTFNGTCLVVTGCACATSNMYAADFVLTSDERLKTNVKPIPISPVNVEYKQFEFISEPNQLRYGVIAQELQKVNPELVRTDNDGMLSVSYIDMLVKEIASLKCRVCELEKRL